MCYNRLKLFEKGDWYYAIQGLFHPRLTPEKVVELYRHLGIFLPGKVAVKLHSGEEGNQNFLGPDFWKPMIEAVSGTVVECNTAYEGSRNTTKKHLATLEKHGWSKHFQLDLLDAQGPTWCWTFPKVIKFTRTMWARTWQTMIPCWSCPTSRDHPMGGFGGAPEAAVHRLRLRLRQGLHPRCRGSRPNLDCRP